MLKKKKKLAASWVAELQHLLIQTSLITKVYLFIYLFFLRNSNYKSWYMKKQFYSINGSLSVQLT